VPRPPAATWPSTLSSSARASIAPNDTAVQRRTGEGAKRSTRSSAATACSAAITGESLSQFAHVGGIAPDGDRASGRAELLAQPSRREAAVRPIRSFRIAVRPTTVAFSGGRQGRVRA
jgi:hypothetical protein